MVNFMSNEIHLKGWQFDRSPRLVGKVRASPGLVALGFLPPFNSDI